MDDLIIIGAIIWLQIEIFALAIYYTAIMNRLPKVEGELETLKDDIYKTRRDIDGFVFNKEGVKKYGKGTTQRVKE